MRSEGWIEKESKEKMRGWESEEREVRHRERKAEIETDWGIAKV